MKMFAGEGTRRCGAKSLLLGVVASAGLLIQVPFAEAAVRTWDGGGGNGTWTTTANWDGDATIPVSGSDSVELVTEATGSIWMNTAFTIGNGQYMSNLVGSLAFRMSGGTLTVAEGGTLDMTGANFWQGGSPRRVVLEGGASARANSYNAIFADWTTEFIANADGVTTFETDNAVQLAGPLEVDLTSYNTNNGLDLVLFNYGSQSGAFSTTNITGYTETNNTVVDYAYQINGAGDMGIALRLNGIQPISWDGGGSDDNWNTAENWDRDFVPAAAAAVAIGSGYTVTNAQKEFATLTIGAGTSVTFGENPAAANVITSSGVIGMSGAFRLSGATVTLTGTGSFGNGITWLDTGSGAINFEDGASFANPSMYVEHRSGLDIGFTLSETGFTTLVGGGLYDGGTGWANVTYNIDISAYDRTRGTTITLMDFSSHTGGFGTFDPSANTPTVNITGHKGGILSFNETTHDLILDIVPIVGTVVSVK